jgi:DNA-binding NarL/FixJ family response regulator
MQNGSVYMNRAKEVGADGYICKDASSEEFNRTLYALLPPVVSMK